MLIYPLIFVPYKRKTKVFYQCVLARQRFKITYYGPAYRRAIICVRLQHIHYGINMINGFVCFKNDAFVREYVFSYVFYIAARQQFDQY